MQIVCSFVEFEAAKFHCQVHMIGCEVDIALLAIEDMKIDDLYTVCSKVNQNFKREDKKFTVAVHDTRLKTLKCFVTNHHELEQVQ